MHNKNLMAALGLGVIALWLLAACASPTPTATPIPTIAPEDIARPSNPGGPGPAAAMKGDAKAGAEVFVANCKKCHGEEGKGEVTNPGSTDGTIPPLNPIDLTLVSADYNTFAYNLDLFIEHGSTPEVRAKQARRSFLRSPYIWGNRKTAV